MDAARDVVLPLRPLTVGELLDASIGLLRRCSWPLLALGLVCAVALQAVMDLDGSAPALVNADAPWGFWTWLAWRMGVEGALIAILAAPASAAMTSILLAEPAAEETAARRVSPIRHVLTPGARWPAVVLAALLVGALDTFAALACGVTWPFVYACTGLVVPVLVADRAPASRFPLRPLALVFKGACRPAGIRLLGYLGWLAVRLAVGFAGLAVISWLGDGTPLYWLLVQVPWVAVDTVALPALACLDACVHLENRMRTEGLDLALSRGYGRHAVEAV